MNDEIQLDCEKGQKIKGLIYCCDRVVSDSTVYIAVRYSFAASNWLSAIALRTNGYKTVKRRSTGNLRKTLNLYVSVISFSALTISVTLL